MFQIVSGAFLILFSILFITDGIREQCNIKNYILKSDVRNAFKDIDLSGQVFRVSDVTLKDAKGHEIFYSKEEIDKAINKLNEKL